MPEFDPNDRSSIRAFMRHQRQQLTDQQQLQLARQLSQHLFQLPVLQRAHNIGVYIANDGEIDPIVFATKSLYRSKNCLLPSLHPLKEGQLWFGAYDGPKIKNRFDIEEPDHKRNEMFAAKQLDVVLMPLVAFDDKGGRLGMGGGFYDRTFEFLLKNSMQKPKLIGLAHHFQQVEALPLEAWDVPLTAIVTDKGVVAKGTS